MPKENTHLFFALKLLNNIKESDIIKIISGYPEYYYLGSIIPDTFYYGETGEITSISDSLHGKEGNPTNQTIIEMLEKSKNSKDIAFTMGYLSHCALDILFHPVIYYLSGNYYDPAPLKRQQAVYMHRHLETCLDINIGNRLRMHTLLQPKLFNALVFGQIIAHQYALDITDTYRVLKRQIFFNRLFASRIAFYLMQRLVKTGLIKDWSQLGLFYGNTQFQGNLMPEIVTYQDLINGEEKVSSVSSLFLSAMTLAEGMIKAAHGYANGLITKETLLLHIPGLSLDTGKLHVPVSDIRNTADNIFHAHH